MEVYLLEQYDNTAVIKSDGNGGDGYYTNISWIHGINIESLSSRTVQLYSTDQIRFLNKP